MYRWCFIIVLIVAFVGPAALGIEAEVTFTEWADYASANNFVTDDLLQGLESDQDVGLWPGGTVLQSSLIGDAGDADNPGQAAPMPGSLVWTATPAYLIYTFTEPVDIQEIRISAVLSDGADDGVENRSAAAGDIALGTQLRSNSGGRPPVRPAENAVEVLFQGETLWTPVVQGRVFSGRRTMPQSFWQGTIHFIDQPVANVSRIKFTLDRTIEWSSGNYGQPTRLCEIDVIGQASTHQSDSDYVIIRPTNDNITYSGFVFPYNTDSAWFKWSGSGFNARFSSDRCRLRFNAPTNSKYWIRVDDGEFRQYNLTSIIDITDQLDAQREEHEIEVVKKTEPDHGVELFFGLELGAGGRMLPTTAADRRILILGDSITVGMGAGLEGETDFLQTYGRKIADMFHADLRIAALSGVGVHYGWRNFTFMQEWALVAKAIANANNNADCPNPWQPDLILINLGTNDASRGIGPEDYIPALRALIGVIRGQYPAAELAIMVPWTYGCYRQETASLVENLSANGVWGLHVIDTDPAQWVIEDGMRDNTHPNFRGHAFAAEMLSETISEITDWPISN